MRKLDLYILKKFLGTYFFAILLIISIAVVFDVAEKIDDFIEKGPTLNQIIFDYYQNFIPYFVNLFSPLFVFIAVIFFTSKMAADTEIIAILSSGVSFRRMMLPYFMGAAIIAALSFVLNGYIIPPANKVRLDFENVYIKNRHEKGDANTHLQIEPGVFVYMGSYSSYTDRGRNFCIEKFDGKELISKLTSRSISYDSINDKWNLKKYTLRNFNVKGEGNLIEGISLDTTLKMYPSDFKRERKIFETMTNSELVVHVEEQLNRGVGNVEEFIIERYKRIASPFSAFILTLIGVSMASRKVRGGIGLHIGVGLGLSFAYILFMTISTTFAISGSMNPIVAVWMPNLIFLFIGVYLYVKAPK